MVDPMIDFNLCKALTVSKKLTPSTVDIVLPHRINIGIGKEDLYFLPTGNNTKVFDTTATPGYSHLCLMQSSNSIETAKPQIQPNIDQITMKNESSIKKNDQHLDKWFGLPKQEMTPDVVKELKAIQLRGVADPKHFFKSTDLKKLPTHFQFATVIDNGKGVGENTNLFTRKRKPKSLVSGLLKNERIREFTQRKADRLQKQAQSGGRKWYKQQYRKRKQF